MLFKIIINWRLVCAAVSLLSTSFIGVANTANVQLVVLGVAQDAGYPQISCYKPHCMAGWKDKNNRKLATSLGVIDHQAKKKFVFEATPDIRQQFYDLHKLAPDGEYELAGIMLTHAHMGHYTGLMHLGREALGGKNIPVYSMPKMREYLSTNGPWSQLVSLNNISLKPIADNRLTRLSNKVAITPLQVPHRDEFSETVGYKIHGPNKTALFIPDIDKWQKWSTSIVDLVKEVDYALLDATFYASNELPNRDMSEVPHPFVVESMDIFKNLSAEDKQKVIFIHFNHSNPLLIEGSQAQKMVLNKGFRFAIEGLTIQL